MRFIGELLYPTRFPQISRRNARYYRPLRVNPQSAICPLPCVLAAGLATFQRRLQAVFDKLLSHPLDCRSANV
jgi:hypothetical protein